MALSDIKEVSYNRGQPPVLPSSEKVYLIQELDRVSIAIRELNRGIQLLKEHVEGL